MPLMGVGTIYTSAAERMFEKFSGPRLRTGHTEDGQRQYGGFSLPKEAAILILGISRSP
jgi:hypothetical protein